MGRAATAAKHACRRHFPAGGKEGNKLISARAWTACIRIIRHRAAETALACHGGQPQGYRWASPRLLDCFCMAASQLRRVRGNGELLGQFSIIT